MIEDKIQQLIEALNENTAALLKHGQVNVTTTTQPMQLVEDKPLPEVKLTKEAVEKIVIPPFPKIKPDPVVLPITAEVQQAKPLDISDLTNLALDVLKAGPTAAVKIKEMNQQLGIERVSKTPPEKMEAVRDGLLAIKKELSQ